VTRPFSKNRSEAIKRSWTRERRHRQGELQRLRHRSVEEREKIAARLKGRSRPHAVREKIHRSHTALTSRTLCLRDRQYAAAYTAQGGRCWICHKTPRVLLRDHNHHTGQFRGLLCTKCNTGLGFFRDDPTRLRRAACEVRHTRGVAYFDRDPKRLLRAALYLEGEAACDRLVLT
jgi:hypothetical protein